jgi:hypothetical protein
MRISLERTSQATAPLSFVAFGTWNIKGALDLAVASTAYNSSDFTFMPLPAEPVRLKPAG